jgi:D-serine deaminase-like pyridoxal phosphate-dependent protein
LALAQNVSRKSNLRLDGLFFYNGHIKDSQTPQEHAQILGGISQMLRETIDAMKKSGLEAKIVSGGSTPTAFESHLLPELTEIRPGTYIYSDFNSVSGGRFSMQESAAQLICTVISDAVPGQVCLDSGSKTLTSDRLATDPEHGGFGRLVDYPNARIVRLSEEHGEVDITKCDRKPRLGERVRVIPNHICPCVNLQDVVWLKGEDGRVESLPVDARGKLN